MRSSTILLLLRILWPLFNLYLCSGTAKPEEIPVIQPFSFPETSTNGQTAVVTCATSSGSKPLHFSWSKDGKDIESVPNTSVHHQTAFSVLTVGPASGRNVGNYTCTARNTFGKDSHTALFVLNESPTWRLEPEDAHVTEGAFLERMCTGHGHPVPQVTWTKVNDAGQEILTPNMRLNAGSFPNGSLLLYNVREDNGGSYTCEISNNVPLHCAKPSGFQCLVRGSAK